MEHIKTQSIDASTLPISPESHSMDYLLDTLDIFAVDIARLDHGELTSIHDTVQDLIALVQQGDPQAKWRLYDGLLQAKDRGFSAYSVADAFRG